MVDYFDIASHQMLYVGDSQVDAEAAQAAKIPFVAFGNKELSAQHHIENLKQLEEILEV